MSSVSDTRGRARANTSTPAAVAAKLTRAQREVLARLAAGADARREPVEVVGLLRSKGLVGQVGRETGQSDLTGIGERVLHELAAIEP